LLDHLIPDLKDLIQHDQINKAMIITSEGLAALLQDEKVG